MKHPDSFAILYCLALLASCTPAISPDEKSVFEQQAAHIVTCNAGADCKEKWNKTLQWVKTHSPYEITTESDSMIETSGPDGLDDSLAFTVTKKANVTPPDVLRDIAAAAKKNDPDAASPKVPVHDDYNISLTIRCNNWFSCTRPRLEASASFVNFVMGPPGLPKPVFGAKANPLSPELAKKMRLRGIKGVIVIDVAPNSLADKAGLHEGDIIVQYNDAPVTTETDLSDMLSKNPRGQPIKLAIIRDKARQTLIVNP